MSVNHALYEHQTLVRHTVSDLLRIADAGRLLGQDRMADAIEIACSDLQESAKHILGVYGKDLTDRLSESQKAVGDTLMALLDAAS